MNKIVATIGAAALSRAAASAAHAAPARNVVLVHGAFTDQTSWNKVAQQLRRKGYNVTLVANPLTSLEDDVAATRKAITAQNGPTVLVGHSWGGVVIGEAGNDPKVSALVYIAAYAPDRGESLQKLSEGAPPTPGQKTLPPDARGYLSIDPAALPRVFACRPASARRWWRLSCRSTALCSGPMRQSRPGMTSRPSTRSPPMTR